MYKKKVNRRKPYKKKYYKKLRISPLVKSNEINVKFRFCVECVNWQAYTAINNQGQLLYSFSLFDPLNVAYSSNVTGTNMTSVNDTFSGVTSAKGFTNFNALYDLMKMRGVKFQWVPDLNVNTTFSVATLSSVFSWMDYDNTYNSPTYPINPPGNYLTYDNLKIYTQAKQIKRYIKTRAPTQANTSTVTPYQVINTVIQKGGWYNSQATIKNGFLYWHIPNNGVQNITTPLGTMIVTYYVTFRDRQG